MSRPVSTPHYELSEIDHQGGEAMKNAELWKDGAIMHIIEEQSQISKYEILEIFTHMFEMGIPLWELTQRIERLRDRNLVSLAYADRDGKITKVYKPKKAGQERPEVAMNRNVVATIDDIKVMFEAWAKKAGLDR